MEAVSHPTDQRNLPAASADPHPLRVLALDLSAEDAAALPESEHVSIRALQAALGREWDVLVTSDTARVPLGELVEAARAGDPDLPVVLLSSARDDDATVAALRAGARDVVERSHPALLAARLENAAQGAATRRAQRRFIERLQASELRFRAAIEGGFDAFVVFDCELDEERGGLGLRIVDVNGFAASLLGSPREELLGQLFADLIPSERADRLAYFTERFRRVYESGVPFQEEYRVRSEGVPVSWLHYQVVPLLNGVAVTARDISELKRTEEALREGEERFRDVVAHVPGVFFTLVHTDDGRAGVLRFDFLTDAIESLTGHTPGEFIGEGRIALRDLMHPDDRERLADAERSLVAGSAVDLDFRIRHTDGRIRWAHVKSEPNVDAGGDVVSASGVMLDVTERKNAEEALRVRDRAIEAMTQGLVIIDAQDAEMPIVYVNHAFEELTGYTSAELHGRHPHVLDGPETSVETIEAVKAALAERRPFDGEIVTYRKDGTHFVSSLRISPVADEGGTVTHFISIHGDESLQRQLEDRLLQAQKMEAVGRLAGGIAHDFNNVLLVIRGYSHVLMSMLGEAAEGWAEAKEIENAAGRASALIRQLLAFSRSQVLQARVFDLNATVAGTQNLLGPLIGEDIELHTSLDARLGTVKADPTQVEQVLVNLAVNARDAMPHGGRLLIRTRNVVIDEHAAAACAVPAGTYSALSVEDTGHGMDAATKARIFEPFFTTKGEGKGTGLGLSMAYGVVKQSGGDIVVTSAPGEGTIVTIYLPHARERNADATARESAPPASEETVLLVEDDDKARQLVGRLLRDSGYDVHEAALPDEALRFVDDHAGPIHLLLSDVVMPQMSGPTLAKHVVERRPDTRVMFVSGYIERAADVDIVSSGADFLQKPFTPVELITTVRRVLDKRDAEEAVAS